MDHKEYKSGPPWGVTFWSGAAWTAALAAVGRSPAMLVFTAAFAAGGIYRIIRKHKKTGQA